MSKDFIGDKIVAMTESGGLLYVATNLGVYVKMGSCFERVPFEQEQNMLLARDEKIKNLTEALKNILDIVNADEKTFKEGNNGKIKILRLALEEYLNRE